MGASFIRHSISEQLIGWQEIPLMLHCVSVLQKIGEKDIFISWAKNY